MRFNGRSIVVIAAFAALQMAICPAVCVAESPDRSADSKSGTAAADPEQAPSHAMPPCHQGPSDAPQDDPGNGDQSRACTSCSTESLLAYTAEKVSDSPSLSVAVFLPAIAATPRGKFVPPSEPDHEPPPTRLYLLKSSFLL